MVSGRIAAKVIHAATSALLARQDTDHLVGSSQGFKHLSTIRLLTREETSDNLSIKTRLLIVF